MCHRSDHIFVPLDRNQPRHSQKANRFRESPATLPKWKLGGIQANRKQVKQAGGAAQFFELTASILAIRRYSVRCFEEVAIHPSAFLSRQRRKIVSVKADAERCPEQLTGKSETVGHWPKMCVQDVIAICRRAELRQAVDCREARRLVPKLRRAQGLKGQAGSF